MWTIRYTNDSARAAAVAVALGALMMTGSVPTCLAQGAGQKTFRSAREASHALYLAVQNHDEKAMMAILGAGKECVCSEDTGQDKRDRAQFLQKYQQMHRLVREPDGTTVLYIGAENWPFPIPLVSKNGAWRFASRAGMREVLCRRIGENEIAVMQACRSLALGEPQKTMPANYSMPFHGYYIRMLTLPEKKASGGAKHTLFQGKGTGRFACVAYPAEYRHSGVMTFLVNQDGAVYEKDLGPNTAKRAKAMVRRNPDPTWHKVE